MSQYNNTHYHNQQNIMLRQNILLSNMINQHHQQKKNNSTTNRKGTIHHTLGLQLSEKYFILISILWDGRSLSIVSEFCLGSPTWFALSFLSDFKAFAPCSRTREFGHYLVGEQTVPKIFCFGNFSFDFFLMHVF